MSLPPYAYAVMMSTVLLSVPAAAQNPFSDTPTQTAHVHGVANLAVAVDAQTIVMDLEMPLVNLVGFEHEPANELEKKALTRAAQTLAQGDRLFQLSAAAGCTLTSKTIEMPTFDHDTHQDVDARYHYHCMSVAELRSLKVILFDAFKHIETLKTIYIDDERQLAKTLTPDQPVFSFR
ncbi:MAG: DUF2796 domain-containing protein [Rhodobiaceae bacterium]|nr:DUF2796 domain-containing protein [Rhodobiaceae bacterium]